MKAPSSTISEATRLIFAGRSPLEHNGAVNTPVYRTSTIMFRSADDWRAAQAAKAEGKRGIYYGRLGTPTSQGLEDALCDLEGGVQTFLFPSGLAAIYHTLAAFAAPGKKLLLASNVYPPSKRAASTVAQASAMTVEFFDPMDLAAFDALLDQDVAVVLVESPGSNSFEVCDVDAITRSAHDVGAVVAMDNTWATPLLFKPLSHGVDLSIQALTKYASGHSDMLGGSVTVAGGVRDRMRAHHEASGGCLSGDDCYAVSKGLRTMAVRLREQSRSGLAIARWMQERSDMLTVRHPALPGAPGHEYWRDNFKGASGLFSVDFHGWGWPASRDFIDGLKLFGLGASWGGYESLVLPCGNVEGNASDRGGTFARIRFNIGLEDVEDLKADIARALDGVSGGKAVEGSRSW